MDFITPKVAPGKWGISERRVQKLCEEGRVSDAIRFGRSWAIPKNAEKPKDGRLTEHKGNIADK